MPFRRSIDFVVLAAWVGLLTGCAELLELASQRFLRDRFLQRGPDPLWMVPLFYLVLFALIGGLAALAHRLWPRYVRWWSAFGAYVFLAGAVLLLFFQQLHPAASAVLALGLAVQATRWARAHAAGFERVVQRSTLPLVALVGLLAVGLPAGRLVAERLGIARLAPSPAGAPNVLLLVLDTVRAWNLSAYGYTRPTTPALERWAGHGVRFDRAFAPASWTLPSHASMFTGRQPSELAVDWHTPLGPQPRTLAEVLRDRGYRTAGFVANTLYATRETGLARGFAHYEDYSMNGWTVAFSTTFGRRVYPELRGLVRRAARGYRVLRPIQDLPDAGTFKRAEAVRTDFLRWLDDAGSARPFFAFLNFMDAHQPHTPPEPYRGRFRSPLSARDRAVISRSPVTEQITSEEARPLVDLYDGSIAYIDAEIGRLLGELERRGMLERTLVIVTSDHGEEYGEHGIANHGASLYRPSLAIPLLMFFPGRIPAGEVVETPVSTRNLAATILDLLDPDAGPAPLPGHSLARLWDTDSVRPDTLFSSMRRLVNQPSWYPASHGDMYAIAFGGLRYIRNTGTGREELYDFERDTLEQIDLSRSERGRAVLPGFRNALARLQGEGAMIAQLEERP